MTIPHHARSRCRHRALAALVPLLSATVLLVACAGRPAATAPVRRDVVGRLHFDSEAGCAWLDPADPTRPDHPAAGSRPVELQFPADVAAQYGSQLRLGPPGQVFRAGQLVTVQDLGPGTANLHCPLAADRTAIRVGQINQ